MEGISYFTCFLVLYIHFPIPSVDYNMFWYTQFSRQRLFHGGLHFFPRLLRISGPAPRFLLTFSTLSIV